MAMTRKEATDLIAAIDAVDWISKKLDAVIQRVNDAPPDRLYKITTIVNDIPVEFHVTGEFIISKLVDSLELANKEMVAKGG